MVNYYDSIEAITATAQNKSSKGSPIVARVTHVRASQVTELTAEKASLAFQFESLEGKSFLVYAETAEEKLSWLTHLSNSLTPVGGVFKRRTAEDVYEKQIRAAEAALEESSGAMVHGAGGGGGNGGVADTTKLAGWALVAEGMRLLKLGHADQARVHLTRLQNSWRARVGHLCGFTREDRTVTDREGHVRRQQPSPPPNCPLSTTLPSFPPPSPHTGTRRRHLAFMRRVKALRGPVYSISACR